MPKRRNAPKQWSPVTLTGGNPDKKEVGRLQTPWQYIISNAAPYPADLFAHITRQLILHPERNSKNIRRADILSDTDADLDIPRDVFPGIAGMICTRTIRRQLMPRNPNLDPELEQTCRLYALEGESFHSLVTYHSHYVESVGVPYYFPDVLGIAFELYEGNVYLAYLPLPETSCVSDRLQRVALNLLMTIHRHWYRVLYFN
jgi:tRNASer (uridine44-2'-O)-methyltransferase